MVSIIRLVTIIIESLSNLLSSTSAGICLNFLAGRELKLVKDSWFGLAVGVGKRGGLLVFDGTAWIGSCERKKADLVATASATVVGLKALTNGLIPGFIPLIKLFSMNSSGKE